MNTELINLKEIVPNRRDSTWIGMVDTIPHEVIGSIYTAIHTFDHDDFQGEEEHQNRAVMELEVKLRELLIAEFPEQLTNAVTYKEELDCDWLAFGLLCNPCYDGKPTVDDGAAMILLLAETLLEEVNRPEPNLILTMGLSVKIGRVEALLATLKGASPMYEMRSYEQNDKANRAKAGAKLSWWKEPLQEVIDQLEIGLSWGLIFRRLVEMGADVPHSEIKEINYVDGKLILVPFNEAHNPRFISERTLISYKKPS